MVNRSQITSGAGKYLALIALSVLLLAMLFPMYMVTINSFKTEDGFYASGPFGLSTGFTLETLKATWQSTDYTTKLLNSTAISLATALLAVGLSLFSAFALGIGRVRGKTLLLLFFLAAVMLPSESLVYPMYYFFKLVKLYDTRTSVVLFTAAFHASFGTYLLTAAFSAFPKELIESAVIDGCNKLNLLFRIIVPITMPTLSVLFVFFFIWTWNDLFTPLIFLISNAKQTVPLAMALARAEHNVTITLQSSAALLGILPCIIFFVIFQRTLTKGITAGSIK
jgi:raffinose/stachyose/melibiose transport system permease protein